MSAAGLTAVCLFVLCVIFAIAIQRAVSDCAWGIAWAFAAALTVCAIGAGITAAVAVMP